MGITRLVKKVPAVEYLLKFGLRLSNSEYWQYKHSRLLHFDFPRLDHSATIIVAVVLGIGVNPKKFHVKQLEIIILDWSKASFDILNCLDRRES